MGIAVVAAVFVLYMMSARAEPGTIESVEKDDKRPTVVLAWRKGERESEVFHSFPPEARSVMAEVVTLEDRGGQAVVVGTSRPVDGCELFLFDSHGIEMGRWDLSSDRTWRDCRQRTAWKVTAVGAVDIDGNGCDEIVVAASDALEHPSRVTVIDPRTGDLGPTFWHFGQLTGLTIVDDFFGPDHPALVLTGDNNKLDGFNDEGKEYPARPYPVRRDEDPPRTEFGRVNVLVILDPRDMSGVGPPDVPETADLRGALPYAYAFVDAPSAPVEYKPEGADAPIKPPLESITAIRSVELQMLRLEDDGPHLAVNLNWHASDESQRRPGATLHVNRHLVVDGVTMPDVGVGETTPSYWKAMWTPIIREHAYLSE